jgi:hypothetical protein
VITGPNIILALKVAVVVVTAVFLASLLALARGRYRLHGRLNLVFMVLTFIAVFGLEFLIRVYDPKMFDYFDVATRRMMAVHLCFSMPATVLMPALYLTGRIRWRRLHLTLAWPFGIAWAGTVVTGVFFLPHR